MIPSVSQSKSQQPDRLPPHSEESERGILGCVLLDQGCYQQLIEFRCCDLWFYDLRHKAIWQAFGSCKVGKMDITIDLINVQESLRQMDMLDKIGGISYLNECMDFVPSAANLMFYAETVREKYMLRQLLCATALVNEKVYSYTGTAESLLLELDDTFGRLTSTALAKTEKTVKSILLDTVLPRVEADYHRGKQQIHGLATGLTYLDKILRGVSASDYGVIAGRPGDGKTSLAMNIVQHVALNLNQPVGVFSLEMTGDSLVERLLFSEAGVSSATFQQGYASSGDFEKLTVGGAKLAQGNIILDDEADQNIDMIAAKARRWVKEYGIKLFVLDYLQLLDDDNSKERVQALRRISKKIVSLKKKLGVPWIVLAQMNRNIETAEVKRPPVLSDLKESGAIEQDADWVMFLYKPLKTENIAEHEELISSACPGESWDKIPRRMNALVAKHRDGPTGKAELLFQKNICKFLDFRDWKLAKGIEEYGKGERESANPVELPTQEEMEQ